LKRKILTKLFQFKDMTQAHVTECNVVVCNVNIKQLGGKQCRSTHAVTAEQQ
jgi:hypothetical protein